jgi:hypothetical protein
MRNRSSAIVITSNTKQRMSTEIGLDNMNENDKKEKISNYIEDQLKNDKIVRKKTKKTDYFINIDPPQYLDVKKEYYSKNEKV